MYKRKTTGAVNSTDVAFINLITYVMLIPAAVWIGPYIWPENTTTYYLALNGGGIALMNLIFLMEK